MSKNSLLKKLFDEHFPFKMKSVDLFQSKLVRRGCLLNNAAMCSD